MAQKTNLNVSPFYDDFDATKDFYKVLFNPGRPVQARELTTLQSILQNQVENFGSHLFKDGSVVIPGNIVYDGQFYAIKLNPTNYGVDVRLYADKLIGKKIVGQTSGVSATVQYILYPSDNINVEYITLYVKYSDSDNEFNITTFSDGEFIECTENIVYGSTTINFGTPIASLISENSNAIGSAASIGDGIYFIRGFFARVAKQTIILDEYSNTPSYRIGLRIFESIVSAKDDSSLYDNAKGFSNYAAPGADRLKIELILIKKDLDDLNDTDFVELLRVENGAIKKIDSKTEYNVIRDYLAQRTYDESGDYSVSPFSVSVHNSLNDRLGNDGLYFSNEKTDQGNTPTGDLMSVKISPGKAYVRGYDVETTSTTIIDVDKPRDTTVIPTASIPFEMGNILRVNNVTGAPRNRASVELYNQRKNSTTAGTGSKIGDARIYICNLTDSAYNSPATNWDLYLYDIQTYTEITLNQPISSAELPATSFVKGRSSGASGYAVSAGGNSSVISLRQTSGTFIVGEQLLINGVTTVSRTVARIKVYSAQDIRSLFQGTSTGFPIAFVADVFLDKAQASGFTALDKITIDTSGNVSCPGRFFTGIKTDSIIRYQKSGLSVETYNRVISIGQSGTGMVVAAVPSVSGVCDGTLPGSTTQTNFALGISQIRNTDQGFLYTPLNSPNIASVNLTGSNLAISDQITGQSTNASGVMTFNLSNISSGITSAFFRGFDEERYSIHYSDGRIEALTSDKFSLTGNTVTISGLLPSQSNVVVNVSLLKNGIKSKVKSYNRSQSLNVVYSKYQQSGSGISTSVVDGLTYNQFYGLRVQDEEISLNYADVARVVGVYESLDESAPVLDRLVFSSTASVDTGAIIGENIIGSTSKAVARVVSKPSSNTLAISYLNTARFSESELVSFEESKIKTPIQAITLGKYKDITNNFVLDKGQKDQYYDYSRLVRSSTALEPTRQLLVVFDYYSVPSSDDGDVFTVASYSPDRYEYDIATLPTGIRETDTLDFRPYPSPFTATNASPFDFTQRTTAFGSNSPKLILAPAETSLIGYSYYLPRIDKISIDKLGNLVLTKGVSAENPKIPVSPENSMDIATISLPAYFYNAKGATITYQDNKRYTMRDIGKIEDRVENLEATTTLSLLEVDTKTLQVQDADGFNRFKSGFFVDDFKNNDLINLDLSSIQVDSADRVLRPIVARNTLKSQLAPAENTTESSIDFSSNFNLIDSNVRKNKNTVTLNYEEVSWISQPLATQVENVNPFHVVSYSGTIKLSPSSDNWVRTINTFRSTTIVDRVANWNRRGTRVVTGSVTTRELVDTRSEQFMRSRNTEFTVSNLKPYTRYYQFFDGNSGVDFVPKLIEIANDSTLQNYGASGSFQVGETVIGYVNGVVAFRARVCAGNHKTGPFNNPSTTYTINPYLKTETLLSTYSSSSKILNIDTFALSEEAQGRYSGYLVTGSKLMGLSSGSVAYVKNLRLISDNFGDLSGSFFIREPNTTPPPPVRITTGTKTYKITSSSTNTPGLPGSNSVSTAETTYRSEGIVNTFLTSTSTYVTEFYDPLAQSFTVGGNIEAPSGNIQDEDREGAFLTAIDLFFAKKDPDNAPVTVEIRTMELGTPTRTIIGNPVTLKPSQVNVSNDASVPTRVTFDYPIFLAPGREYAVVILAPQSINYEMWIAEMGKKTVGNNGVDSVIYSSQFAIGSLFKSQNGSIWTANQYQDLKFKLYKAKFTQNLGTVYFYNPSLDESNGFIEKLQSNPLRSYPKTLRVGITSITNTAVIGIFTGGRKVSESSKTYNYGYVVGTGSSVSTLGITTGGFGYTTQSNVSTYAITGQGSGLTVNITASNGIINSVTPVLRGNGYVTGDVVGIVTSTAGNTGNSAAITVTGITTGIDTLYLTGVQGQSFTPGASLIYYDNSNVAITSSTTITSTTPQTDQNTGNFLFVSHYNHGMYAKNNKIAISNVLSNIAPATLTDAITVSSSSIPIGAANTSRFSTFEGMPVSATNPGYVLIENEIIRYESIGSASLQSVSRAQDSTIADSYPVGTLVYEYELNGVSLRRINTTHDISDFKIDIDSYYLEIDRSKNGVDRSVDNSPSGFPQLSFNDEKVLGGSEVRASENIQFDSLTPSYSILNPGSNTSVSAAIRTVSGTSVSGNETSFVDQGFEPVELNAENDLTSTRIVCSRINEQTYMNDLPRNKSFTTTITLSTKNSNLSPQIYTDNAFTEFRSNRINRPISDYTVNSLSKGLSDDPHAAVYVSNIIKLKYPATSLKVILSANRPESADFRVLYSLIRPDSSEVTQPYELFPGYDNMVDTNGDNFGDTVINPSKNSGRPDAFVAANLDNEYSEYQFTADNLDQFVGYVIKIVVSSTDQSKTVKIKSLRTLAVR